MAEYAGYAQQRGMNAGRVGEGIEKESLVHSFRNTVAY